MALTYLKKYEKDINYYKPNIISIIVTKEGHPRHSRLYRTSKTIRRGVINSRKKLSTWKYRNVETRRTDILTY